MHSQNRSVFDARHIVGQCRRRGRLLDTPTRDLPQRSGAGGRHDQLHQKQKYARRSALRPAEEMPIVDGHCCARAGVGERKLRFSLITFQIWALVWNWHVLWMSRSTAARQVPIPPFNRPAGQCRKVVLTVDDSQHILPTSDIARMRSDCKNGLRTSGHPCGSVSAPDNIITRNPGRICLAQSAS